MIRELYGQSSAYTGLMQTVMAKRIISGLIVFWVFITGSNISGGENPHLFSTGRTMEIDRLASAWLIKRYVDLQAEFIFFPDGELITAGTAFDTPDARFCRTHNRSTFEILMQHFKISDSKLDPLAQAIHEIEINYWSGKKGPLANALTLELNALIRENSDPVQCLKQSLKIFDEIVNE
jgi:hypothetical protein